MTEQNVYPNPIDEDAGAEPLPGRESDPAVQLAHLIPALWRTMRRASRTATRLPANESQVLILRLLVSQGAMSPSRLAEELGIARPTVSNLLRDMVRTGLVARTTAVDDHRSIVISATSDGQDILETFRRDRAEALRAAIELIPLEDQEQLKLGVGALRHLQRQLEAVADAQAAALADSA